MIQRGDRGAGRVRVGRADREFIRRHWDRHTTQWIGKRLGLTPGTVSKHARAMGLPSHRNDAVELSGADWERIEQQRLAGRTWASLAKEYGFTADVLCKRSRDRGLSGYLAGLPQLDDHVVQRTHAGPKSEDEDEEITRRLYETAAAVRRASLAHKQREPAGAERSGDNAPG